MSDNNKNQMIKFDYYDITHSIESDGDTISNSKDTKSDAMINENIRWICTMKGNDNDDTSNYKDISQSNNLNNDKLHVA